MKNIPGMFLKETHITIALIFCMLSVPLISSGQDKKIDIEPVVTCTEFIGDGKLVAHFGYENKGKKTIVIDEAGSVVTYNYGQAKKNGVYIFDPGVTEVAFSQEYDHKDRVEWTVKFPDGTEKTTDANINSNHCRGAAESLNIIPGYYPPEGGKEYNSKIGAELTALYNGYTADPGTLDDAPGDIFRIEGTKVLIEVVAYEGQYEAMISSLANLDPEFDLVTAKSVLDRATGWIDISDLLLLNEMDPLYYARPVYPGVGNYMVPATGLVNSQGDFAMHSDFARLGYDIKGTGVKIGVLSNSYDTQDGASLDVENGDLPGPDNPNYKAPVHVLKDITTPNVRLSDEGRAMLQIIHDIAPGAELAFRTGYLGEQDMAIGIRALATAGCDIIVDDLSYITEPFFQDGIISKTIDSVASEGITFFSSAGNFGKASCTGIYDPAPAPSTINGDAHAFDGENDIFQNVVLEEGNYTLVLQWDDGSDATMNTTDTDLDLFLSDDVGFSLLGFNRENIGGFPIEVVPFSVVGGDVNANIVISRAAGPIDADVIFKYILFRGGSVFKIQEYGAEGSSTIVGHPNAAGAISVGAVRFDKNQIYSPGEFDEPVIMSFSSMGGTPVGGTPLMGEPRSKPDITAPNGVNTTIDLGNGDWEEDVDGDGVPDPGHPDNSDPDTKYANFFGTSAASPHAAGVAALIMEAKSKFDPVDPDIPEPGNLVTPGFIRNLMKSTALEMGDPGEDYVSGAGFIQAHKALMTFANPTPYVESLILAGEKPGTVIKPFSFTMKGDFFTDATKVMIRGELLDLEVQLIDEQTIFVENHPGFLGNPVVQAFTPDISPSKIDGGESNPIYFSSTVRDTVVFTASSASKKYGSALPTLTGSTMVKTADNQTLTLAQAVSANIMLQDEADRLSQITFTTKADENSDVGLYKIDPVLPPIVITDDMDEDEIAMLNEIENSISEKFLLQYIHSELEIEKIPLKITPENVDLVYGEKFAPDGLGFKYEIDESFEIVNPTVIYGGAETAHRTALANEISLVRGIAMVNGIPTIRGIAMVNGVTMVRGIALVNGVEVRVEVEGADTTVYVGGEPVVSGVTLIRGIAMVNDLPFVSMTEIVRGIALVNGDKVTFDDGYMTELNGTPLDNAVPAVRGIAMVNEPGVRGIALVNGFEVIVDEFGVTTIGGEDVPDTGIAEVNGIPVIRGIALVNSSLISRGIALVNGLEVPIENGLPLVRGIALVNGIPMTRGIAMVNNLEVYVDNGTVTQVKENGAILNELSIRGIALVNDVALVNGTELINRGIALVNGIALTDDGGDGDETDLVNLENMNVLASIEAITNGVPNLRGIAMVNGLESMDGHALNIADGTVQDNGTIVYESATPTTRGIAMVNGLAYVRGIAMVNNIILDNGSVIVNGSSVNEEHNSGSILVFDATDLSEPAEAGFKPISFITGTTVGQHWIVPGTFLSKNFNLTYGLGTLTIVPLEVNVTPDIPIEYINEGDPLPEFSFSYDTWINGDSGSDGYIAIRDSDGVVYDPASDESAGTYTVIPMQFNSNYVFNIETAKLHVNPYGPGTRAIKPVLNCVVDQGDGTYLANFEYKNDNDADYYIPVGDNNTFEVAGDGIIEFYDSYPDMPRMSQPTLFKVGGGEFQAIFDAESEIRWTLTSVEKDQKTSNATSATSSSTKCTGNLKSASVDSDILGEELDSDLLLVYPVPVVDKLHITMKDIENYKMIMLYDFAGRSVPVRSIEKRSDMLEIDMAELASGPYLIRIVMEETTRTVTLLKQ